MSLAVFVAGSEVAGLAGRYGIYAGQVAVGDHQACQLKKNEKKIEFSFAILRSVVVIPLTRHVSFLFLLTANK